MHIFQTLKIKLSRIFHFLPAHICSMSFFRTTRAIHGASPDHAVRKCQKMTRYKHGWVENEISWLSKLAIHLFAPKCLSCGLNANRFTNLCLACEIELPILPTLCPICANPLFGNTVSMPCGACLKHPQAFTKILPLFPYESPIIQWITKFKFQSQLEYSRLFSVLMQARIQEKWYHLQPLPDLIIPIPLHLHKLRERGFNQAVEIARPIARALSIECDISSFKRHIHTAPQSGLSKKDRQKNMANAFTSRRRVDGLHIAVIDDVVTTGATVSQFSALIKSLGAKQIDIWCLARRY